MGLFPKKKKLPAYLISEDGETIVIFIHGLAGKRHTWYKFATKLKEIWNSDKNYKLHYDTYYQKNFFNPILNIWIINPIYNLIKGHHIDDLANHLDSTIRTICHGYNNVILVGHSMGGLVARKYLVDKLKIDKDLGKVKALITYATPHKGSIIANRVCIWFFYIFRINTYKIFKQINNLSKSGDFIEKLNFEWGRLRVDDKIDFIRVVGLNDWVVDVDSAQLKLDKYNIHFIADKDHFTIIEPHKEYEDNALFVTYNYLKDFDSSKYNLTDDNIEAEENKYEF